MSIDPLNDISIPPVLAALPKADLHIHQEDVARFEQVLAQRQGRSPYDPRPWIRQMLQETAPGMGRIDRIYGQDHAHAFDDMHPDEPDNIIAKMACAMTEEAQDGAVLVELRFGASSVAFARDDFMALFREAERQVQARYPNFHAEAVVYIGIWNDPAHLETVENQIEACFQAASHGLAGVDFRVDPYDSEVDPALWKITYRIAEQIRDANLGITLHTGEFSRANILAALQTPGIRRLGHAVYAASDPRILAAVARSGVTIECSLTCNVVLGAVPTYEAHPIHQFIENGIPVTLNTDLPVHLHTTIGREYAIAAAMGFSTTDLLQMTRNAVQASFTTEPRRSHLFQEMHNKQKLIQLN